MPKRSAAHAEAMREQILEGGRRAFIAGGFRGTSVPSIAAEAGVVGRPDLPLLPQQGGAVPRAVHLAGTPDELRRPGASGSRRSTIRSSASRSPSTPTSTPCSTRSARRSCSRRWPRRPPTSGSGRRSAGAATTCAGFSARSSGTRCAAASCRPTPTWTRSRPSRRCCSMARWSPSPNRATPWTGTPCGTASSRSVVAISGLRPAAR